jgi:nitroreductase
VKVDEAIRTRRTHKVYRPDPVPREQLDQLFELARWAPNHHLTNPWRFRVLGPRSLEALKQAHPEGAAKLERAPTLVACSVVQTGDEAQDEEDAAAGACAVYAIMLAAHGRGIATYWRTPGVLRSADGRAAVGIGDDEYVLGLLHLGYADRDWQPPARLEPGGFVQYLD